MDSPAQYQPLLDELIAFASAESRKDDLLAAKADYFKLTGEVFEDDTIFELRMASFLDYYLFDRKNPASGKSPAEELLEQKTVLGNPMPYRPSTETVHGLFEVKK